MTGTTTMRTADTRSDFRPGVSADVHADASDERLTSLAPFDPTVYFAGDVRCDGFIADRAGSVRRSFVIYFHGAMSGGALHVRELMYFNDGELTERRWKFAAQAPGHWHATANDIPGIINITHGKSPQEARWRYKMPLPVGGRQMMFSFEDIMIQTGPGTMTALTNITKYGVRVAQIVTGYLKI